MKLIIRQNLNKVRKINKQILKEEKQLKKKQKEESKTNVFQKIRAKRGIPE